MAKENWLHIEFVFQPKKVGRVKIGLPIWRPGRYQVQNFAKNIPEIKAFQGDKKVLIQKVVLSSWEIEVLEQAPIKLVYSY
jgi:predicted metalloprotease with PDZ domain